MFDFLGVVDQGEAFSARSVGLLRRLKLIFASIAAYEVLGFVGISVATLVAMGQMKTYMLLSLFAAEVVDLFFFALVALLERLFATALNCNRRTNSRSEPCLSFTCSWGLVVGRQVQRAHGGFIDTQTMAPDESLVAIELKRNRVAYATCERKSLIRVICNSSIL